MYLTHPAKMLSLVQEAKQCTNIFSNLVEGTPEADAKATKLVPLLNGTGITFEIQPWHPILDHVPKNEMPESATEMLLNLP